MIGVIGGSGLDDPDILKDAYDVEVETPFGKPSSPLKIGKIGGRKVALLARHGRKHTIMPSNVPFRANIWALKEQGCTAVLASTACGSLREEIAPGHLVFPDQFIDRTTKRAATFYDKGKVCHIPMAEPFCPKLRKTLAESAKKLGIPFHERGTVITIEGPRFSSRAESALFRSWKADIINMTTVPEVVLAREAGVCYQSIAMATDYDCWKEREKAVTIEEVLKVMEHNAENVKKLFAEVGPRIAEKRDNCSCAKDIECAVIGV
jgi:5'-methylthioadenosine phosphorylase